MNQQKVQTATNEKVWLSSPHMGGAEIKFVNEAFETNWIAPLGPHVNGFEEDLCQFQKGGYAAALSSGTAAIHLGLIIKGVQAGDDVICQSFTFSASANPIAYQGATPVFVGSEATTWNMDPLALEEAIIDRTKAGKTIKAIIPVHLYGMPAQMDKIIEIAERHNIPIIEDAAEALGSSINAKMMGTFGEIGVLSFNGNKIITTGGGGSLISANEEHVKMARFLATQARDAAPHYQHSHIGYNYRLSNVAAGIGRGQMTVLSKRIEQRRAVYARYEEAFRDIKEIAFLPEPKGYFSNRWLTCILVDQKNSNNISRETIRLAMEAENIEARPLWKPMHLQPVFSEAPYYGNRYEEMLFDNGLCLPSGSNMSLDDQQRVIDIIRKLMLN